MLRWKEILVCAGKRFLASNGTMLASALAYSTFFAIPSVLIVATGLFALIAAPQTAEAPYSGWNVAGLVCCAVLLLMTGMMMYDLTRNMWQWDIVGKTNVSIFDSIEKTIGWIGDK